MTEFEDKVGIVTGGGTGIGLATAQRFVARRKGRRRRPSGRVLASATAVIDPRGHRSQHCRPTSAK